MDKNTLTEQRRETVIGLLKSMNIKKSTVGGFDKDDVYECMQQLCDLYEKNIEELENAYESEISELRNKYQKYDDNNELYVSLIMEAKKSSNEIINQAKSEVETILAEGREQVAQQEKDLEQMRVGMEAEKNAITTELNASREAVEAEKAAMRAEVEAEKEKAAALKNKYRQQINAMEEEFAEIKTNILRTAGRVDSLKSKLADDEEAEWNLEQDLDAVDFPVFEQEVESISEPEIYIEPEQPEAATEPEIAEEPKIAAEPAEEQQEEPAALTLEDLIGPEDGTAEPAAEADELNFDDIEIELPDLAGDAPQAADEVSDSLEISFEGLEDLFKDEK